MSNETNSQNTQVATQAPVKSPINFGDTGVRLTTIEDAFRFSTAVVKSGLAPKGFATPEAVLIALQHGAEIGMPPMASLQSIAVINGRPGIYGDAALALVRGSGLCAHYGEAETNDTTDPLFRELQFAIFEKDVERVKKLHREFSVAQSKHKTDADDFGVTVATARKDGLVEFERFTIGDAKRAKLWGKVGPWTEYPKRMLKFRCRGFKLRDVYGDVLKGLRTVEELHDIPAEPKNVTGSASLASLVESNGDATPTVAATVATETVEITTLPEHTAEDRERVLDILKNRILDGKTTAAAMLKQAKADGLVSANFDGELFELPTADLVRIAEKGGK